jgi:predicted nucleic acid-binding protein
VGWIESLHGATVGLDTAPLIYWIEKHPSHAAKLRPFFSAAERQEFRLVTSYITVVEVLVHPLRNGRSDLARDYREILLRSPALTTIPLDEDIAEEAARLRAVHKLKTPDAIQLATATTAGATWFVSNDAHLPSLAGISYLLIDSLPVS